MPAKRSFAEVSHCPLILRHSVLRCQQFVTVKNGRCVGYRQLGIGCIKKARPFGLASKSELVFIVVIVVVDEPVQPSRRNRASTIRLVQV